MKTDEQLVKLSQNPYYKMSDAELNRLENIQQEPVKKTSSVTIESKKKESQTTLGNAPVKETGKLAKHPSDPVNE